MSEYVGRKDCVESWSGDGSLASMENEAGSTAPVGALV